MRPIKPDRPPARVMNTNASTTRPRAPGCSGRRGVRAVVVVQTEAALPETPSFGAVTLTASNHEIHRKKK